eukprot:c24756_g1_i1 orf=130-576(+)
MATSHTRMTKTRETCSSGKALTKYVDTSLYRMVSLFTCWLCITVLHEMSSALTKIMMCSLLVLEKTEHPRKVDVEECKKASNRFDRSWNSHSLHRDLPCQVLTAVMFWDCRTKRLHLTGMDGFSQPKSSSFFQHWNKRPADVYSHQRI